MSISRDSKHRTSKTEGTYKICLSGQYGVGKTSIFRRVTGEDFLEDTVTSRIDSFDYHVSGIPSQVSIFCIYIYM